MQAMDRLTLSLNFSVPLASAGCIKFTWMDIPDNIRRPRFYLHSLWVL